MIDKMRKAMAVAEAFGEPVREYRLHPDDYKALREQCKPWLQYPAAGADDSFAGLKVIQDADAPRLPRLKPPNVKLKGGPR